MNGGGNALTRGRITEARRRAAKIRAELAAFSTRPTDITRLGWNAAVERLQYELESLRWAL